MRYMEDLDEILSFREREREREREEAELHSPHNSGFGVERERFSIYVRFLGKYYENPSKVQGCNHMWIVCMVSFLQPLGEFLGNPHLLYI